ncbi:MAG TPA: hypothetical protein VK772_00190 [Puia sp.]|nr:hypothetical protein [Puia sp.]
MKKTNNKVKEREEISEPEITKPNASKHLGSSNAFEETENPLSKDLDNISDERLDELLDE